MVKLDSMHRHIKTAYTNLRENTGIHGLHENEFFLMVIRLRSGHMTKNYCSGYSWFHIDTFLFCSVSSTHPSIHECTPSFHLCPLLCLLVTPSISLFFTPPRASLCFLTKIQLVGADSLLCRRRKRWQRRRDGKHCWQKPLTRIFSTLARLPRSLSSENRESGDMEAKNKRKKGEATDRILPPIILLLRFLWMDHATLALWSRNELENRKHR